MKQKETLVMGKKDEKPTRVRWHWQNLNTNKNLKPVGSGFWHGRAWLYVGQTTLKLAWALGRLAKFCHVHLNLNSQGDPEICVSVAIPFLFSLWFAVEDGRLEKHLPGEWKDSTLKPGMRWRMPIEREIGVSIHHGKLWFSLWNNPHEWSSVDPWWWEFSFSPADFFLGRQEYSEKLIDEGVVDVVFPVEESYRAKCRLYTSYWKRSRWPWPVVINRATIEPETPIPVPGKGENSWDLDDDVVHSMTCPAETMREAAEKLAVSVMRTRKRYGGVGWKPEVKG